ncbi:MAG TPA: trimeric intracellular cation channel family protein [Verrucomicrobiae bacterium]|nr:trimeric intracellular cation channel family protein [Verrucomicrobiae bacterium]
MWLKSDFYLPPAFDITAVFFFALTGVLAAVRRGYDFIGLFTMAFVAGLGGALIRDGLFLQDGPPALTKDGRYIVAVLAGCAAGWCIGHPLERFRKVIAVLDAVGLGTYSVVGVAKALAAGLSVPAAILVGVINACGGGLLRDVITREEPLLFKPGQFYAVASLLGCGVFVTVTRCTTLGASRSALIAICGTFVIRVLAIAFNWRTTAIQPWGSALEETPPRENPPKTGTQ